MSPRPPLCAPSLFQVKGLIIENTFTSVEDMVGQVCGLPGAEGACPERTWSDRCEGLPGPAESLPIAGSTRVGDPVPTLPPHYF